MTILKPSVRSAMMLAAAAGICTAAVGVGSAKTTVTIWTCFGMQPQQATLESIFRDFEKANPDIKVKHVVPTSDSGILPEKLLTAMAGGVGPDMAWVAPERVSWLYDAGDIVPISQMEKLGGKLAQADFYKGMWQANYRRGEKWGVPFENSNLALYYNKTLFANAGMAHAPRTWDEYTDMAVKLTSKEKRTTGTGVYYADWYFPMWLKQKGAAFTNDEGTKITWASAAAEQAVQWYTDLQVKYKATGGDFTTGRTAMTIDGNWAYPSYQKTKVSFGIAPLPVAEGGTPATFAAYKELVVLKAGNKSIAACWRLEKYIMEPAVFSRWCLATAYLPVTRSQAKSPEFAQYLQKNPELGDGHLAQSDDAYSPPILRNTNTIWAVFQEGINAIVAGKKSVHQALAESAVKAQAFLRAK